MKQIFTVLYEIHPLLPAIYLLVMAVGLLTPGIYCWVRNLPMSFGLIWGNAKRGDVFARFSVATYLIFAFLSSVCLILVLYK